MFRTATDEAPADGFDIGVDDVTVRIDFVTTERTSRRSTYFFCKARTDGGKSFACCCCFLVNKLEADFRTEPGAIGVVGVGVDVAAVGVVVVELLTAFRGFSFPFSLPPSSSLEAALEGMLARLKWSNSGGKRFVPKVTKLKMNQSAVYSLKTYWSEM